jgi:hypothetical protein
LEKQNRWNRPFRASFRDNRTRPKQAQPTKPYGVSSTHPTQLGNGDISILA